MYPTTYRSRVCVVVWSHYYEKQCLSQIEQDFHILMHHEHTIQDEQIDLAQVFLFLLYLAIPVLLNTAAPAHPSLLQQLNSKTKGARELNFSKITATSQNQGW